MKNRFVITIPHLLHTTITIKKKMKGDRDESAGYVRRIKPGEYLMVTDLPIRGVRTAGNLVHEIVHILDYICEDGYMKFTNEKEHMAYLAGYIFERVCELKIITIKKKKR